MKSLKPLSEGVQQLSLFYIISNDCYDIFIMSIVSFMFGDEYIIDEGIPHVLINVISSDCTGDLSFARA